MATKWHKCPGCGQRIKLLRKRCVQCAEEHRAELAKNRRRKSKP